MCHSSDRNGIHLQLHSLYIIIFDNRFYDYLTPPLNSVVRRSNDLLPEKRLNCLKFVTTYCCNVHGQKGSPITAAFAASDRSYHLNIWRLGESCHNVVTTFFLFSKCLICLTHSHNASAVSLIFFCDSEYDQSLVPRSHFLFGQHQERPDICAWQKGIPADEIETWLSIHVCCDNVVSVLPWEKACFFFSPVPCLGKGSVLMGLHWLPAGQRVDFKMHSDTCNFFIARVPYIYVLIREPLSYHRPGKNLPSLQTLKDHILCLTLKFMVYVPFPLLLQNC